MYKGFNRLTAQSACHLPCHGWDMPWGRNLAQREAFHVGQQGFLRHMFCKARKIIFLPISCGRREKSAAVVLQELHFSMMIQQGAILTSQTDFPTDLFGGQLPNDRIQIMHPAFLRCFFRFLQLGQAPSLAESAPSFSHVSMRCMKAGLCLPDLKNGFQSNHTRPTKCMVAFPHSLDGQGTLLLTPRWPIAYLWGGFRVQHKTAVQDSRLQPSNRGLCLLKLLIKEILETFHSLRVVQVVMYHGLLIPRRPRRNWRLMASPDRAKISQDGVMLAPLTPWKEVQA